VLSSQWLSDIVVLVFALDVSSLSPPLPSILLLLLLAFVVPEASLEYYAHYVSGGHGGEKAIVCFLKLHRSRCHNCVVVVVVVVALV